MHSNTLTKILFLLTLLTLLTTTALTAPIGDAAGHLNGGVPIGAAHFARSIPELIAERKARDERALAARVKGRQVGKSSW